MKRNSSSIDDIISDQEQDETDSVAKTAASKKVKNLIDDEGDDDTEYGTEEEKSKGDGIESIMGDDESESESDDDSAEAEAVGEEQAGEEDAEDPEKGVLIGKVEQFFSKIHVAAIKLRGKLEVGDTIEIYSNDDIIKLKVSSMQIDKESVQSADDGDSVGIKVSIPVEAGSKVYRKD